MGYNGYGQPLTEPLSNFDVAKALGKNTLDIGSLCTSESINKWSFHKPMVVDTPQGLTLTQKNNVDDGFTNLSELYCEYPADYTEKWNNRALEWIYAPPAIGDWFRLTDFIGYNHTSKKPQITLESTIPEDEREAQTIKVTISCGLLPFLSGFTSQSLGIAVFNNIASGSFMGIKSVNYNNNGESVTATFSPETDFGMTKASWFFAVPCMGYNQRFLPLDSAYAYVWAEPVLYRTFKNVLGTFTWSGGGYIANRVGSRCQFSGDFTIANNNKNSSIFAKVKVTANHEDTSASSSILVIHETEAPNSAIVGYKEIEPGDVYSIGSEEGTHTWDWDNSYNAAVEIYCEIIYPVINELNQTINHESFVQYQKTMVDTSELPFQHIFDFTTPYKEIEKEEVEEY